jgi:DNA invertase Pin-like site-specific DNA recombinase
VSTIRSACYVRVSTANKLRNGDAATFDQNPEVQQQPLLDLIQQRGWRLHRIYADRASGAEERRPGLDALLADARRGLFDVVLVWRFDRFARSVKQLVMALEEFRSLGIDFVSHQEALDTSTPMGKAMFTVIAAMAELERAIIRERVMAGLDHAHRNGTKSGRPVGRPRVIVDADRVIHLRDADRLSWAAIARMMHSSSGSVRRIYAAATGRLQPCQNPLTEVG